MLAGDDLFFGQLAGHFARELAASWQNRFDCGGRLAGRGPSGHPVTDSGQTLQLMPQTAGMLRLQLAALGKQPVDVVEFNDDSGGNQAIGGMRRKHARPLVIPPEIG